MRWQRFWTWVANRALRIAGGVGYFVPGETVLFDVEPDLGRPPTCPNCGLRLIEWHDSTQCEPIPTPEPNLGTSEGLDSAGESSGG